MAAIKKYTEAQLKRYVGHLTQEAYFKHQPSNKEINMALHHLNKNLTPERGESKKEILRYYRKRKKEVYAIKRKDIVTAFECVITAPAGLTEIQRVQFFDVSQKFLEETYGKENILTSIMHANEGIRDTDGKVLYGHWHMHSMIMPITKIENKKESQKNFSHKLCCKEIINLKHLKQWHDKFQKYCDANLPFKAPVYMGGKTGGNNRSIEELKLESKYQIEHQKVLELEQEREKLQEQITHLNEQLAKLTWDNSNTWGNTSTWGEYTYGA